MNYQKITLTKLLYVIWAALLIILPLDGVTSAQTPACCGACCAPGPGPANTASQTLSSAGTDTLGCCSDGIHVNCKLKTDPPTHIRFYALTASNSAKPSNSKTLTADNNTSPASMVIHSSPRTYLSRVTKPASVPVYLQTCTILV